MNWIEKLNDEHEISNEVLTFEDYMNKVEANAVEQIRPNCVYLKDMFDYFERDKRGGFNLFKENYPDSPPVHGQIKAQENIYRNLLNFNEEGFNNKFILLVGPNGSSKSSLVRKMMNAAEIYSKANEGPLYTFSWIFPVDNFIKGSLGLNPSHTSHHLNSFALLDDKDISAILTSDLKDHPLLLMPIIPRQKIIETLLEDYPERLDSVKKSYLYNGDVSKRNRMIYDALLKNYKGKHSEVLKHIRVERFIISKRHSTAAVTIEPQLHVDARMQQITMDKRLASLPPSLQSLNLFSLHGEVILANRGMVEFSDLLKRPLDAFKYLLMTMETKTINLQGILTELDLFFIGSSNEIHLSAFKQHPDFNSFKGRINFVRVPYLLNAEDEERIYEEQVLNLTDRTKFEPHALSALCNFAVMTRIRPAQAKNFKDKRLAKIASALTPLEKTLLYTNHHIPKRLDSEDKKVLKIGISEIENEFINENLYEGKFGISPREIKHIIYELSSENDNISFIEVLEYLTKFIERKNEYDFLNIAAQGEYNNPIRFIDTLKEYCLEQFDTEVRDCMGLVDQRSYEEYIEKYVVNINALIKNEKVKNSITGKFEVASMHLIQEFESSISLTEKPEQFRTHLISTLGAYFLDNPGKAIQYTEVFPELVNQLQESFQEEQKKLIKKISQSLVYYISEYENAHTPGKKTPTSTPLTEDGRKTISSILNTLHEKYGYSERGSLTLFKFLIKEKY